MYWRVPVAAFGPVLAATLALSALLPADAAVPLSGVVSAAPVPWTPNVFAGTNDTSVCDQWFGSGGCGAATIWSTAVVNGEVVVAGAFTQACQPGPASSGHCQPGTLVTRDDVFAYQLGTGKIDPNFTPQLDQGPVYSAVAGPDGTVYLGGAFTTVNGASHQGLVQLSVAPGTASDGQVVSTFTGGVNNYVKAMAYNGNALYIGGIFTSADGAPVTDVARLNATTGALDPTFSMTLSNPADSLPLKVESMALTNDGQRLAIGGTFLDVNGQSRPRLALISTGGGLGATASLANWAAPILANNCSSEHDYVRGIDFSPDGSWLVIADDGYMSSPTTAPGVCDAAARFPAAPTGTNVQPTWINYSGGDSLFSVQVTNSVVYVGGHFRWLSNECGNNHICEANAVLTMGYAAIDARTGLTIPWYHPLTLRGNGVVSLTAFPAGAFTGSNGGVLLGTDVSTIAAAYHGFEALFPLNSTTGTPTFGAIPSGMFALGRIGGHDESTAGTAAMCVDDPGNSAAPGTDVELATCTNGAEQNWTVQTNGNITINGLCLDTAGQGTAAGTKVTVNTCGTSATQVWSRTTANALVNQASGLCLDDPGSSTANGTVLDIATCTGGANQVWPVPAVPAPPSLTPVGPVTTAAAVNSRSQPACLADTGDSTTPGTAVEMHTCLGGTSQDATIEPGGAVQIHGLCLDTAGGSTAPGAAVVLDTCDSAASSQVWEPQAGHILVNQASGLCLAAASSTNGSALSIAACSPASTLQQWWLPAV